MRIHDSFVVHQLVPFVLGMCVQVIGFWIAHDLMGFGDLNLSGFQEWLFNFIQDILLDNIVILLTFPLTVKAETTNLALNLSVLGGVPIILWAP